MAEITLSDTNQYFNGLVTVFSNGDAILEREIEPPIESSTDDFRLIVEGNYLDRLAFDAYNSKLGNVDAGKYWWVVADAITELENPLDLVALTGSQLRLPDIIKFKANQ